MPRHNALLPLSHDHHHSLVLALRLKKGGPASQNDRGWPIDIREQAKATLEFANETILPHFAIEEDILFPICNDFEEAQPMIDQLRREHDEMRGRLSELQDGLHKSEGDLSKSLQAFGVALERHIRTEERQFFPMIESMLTPAAFERLGRAIHKQHEERPPDCAII